MMVAGFHLWVLGLVSTAAFQGSPVLKSVLKRSGVTGGARRRQVVRMGQLDSVSASFAETVSKIRSAIPELEAKPTALEEIEAFDAPGAPNVAWLARVSTPALASLTIFNGPLTDVPHLASRVVVMGDEVRFFLDWRPRAYGAYETIKPDGTYPGPEELGRVAFEYSGARNTMEQKFYTPELKAWVDTVLSDLEGASRAGPASELDASVRGPLCLDLVAPATESNLAKIAQASAHAAQVWLDWQLDPSHEHRPGAPVNSQYVYDTKKRQEMYSVLLAVYSSAFGPDHGASLAAAESGPLDEAYVGGGS